MKILNLCECEMAKVAMAADFHFGVSGRLEDILWSARVIRQYCSVAHIDTVIILGDLFHDRKAIEIDVLTTVVKFFEETLTQFNQQWIVFPGNHDMFLRHSWDINSLVSLKRHLTVIEDIKILTIDDARFWVLPFVTYEKPYMKILRKIEQRYEEGDVLLTHIGVKGATLNTCFLLKDWSTVDFQNSKFQKVFTGHFHSKQQQGDNVYYPGSPIPFKFDEGDVPHGFYVYDTDTKDHKFINIWKAGEKFFPNEKMPPQFYTITDEVMDQIEPEDLKNGIVRVAIINDKTLEERKRIKEKLLDNGVLSVRWLDKTQKIESKQVISAKPSKNLFQAWVDQDKTNLKSLDPKILVRINDEIVREGDEKYVVEDSD